MFVFNLIMERTTKNLTNDTDSLRKDAKENKRALIQAALKLFKTEGPDVTLSEIAKIAKVSRMTCYRNFPDKKAIIEAVFNHNLDKLADYALLLKNDAQAFFKLLYAVLELRIDYNLLLPYMSEEQSIEATKRLFEIFKNPIGKAKKTKQLRHDFSIKEDLILVIVMLGGAISHVSLNSNKIEVNRAIQFILKGITPPSSISPLENN